MSCTILFSVNQNSSDVFDSWVEELNANLSGVNSGNVDNKLDSALAKFVDRKLPVMGTVLQSFYGEPINYWSGDLFGDNDLFSKMWDQKKFDDLLTRYSDDIEKMKKRARDGYINPIALHWETINDLKTTFLIWQYCMSSSIGFLSHILGAIMDQLNSTKKYMMPV